MVEQMDKVMVKVTIADNYSVSLNVLHILLPVELSFRLNELFPFICVELLAQPDRSSIVKINRASVFI